ncbi:FkbM family methyltransferase [Nonomuraea sp. bgisy101]|uniref:FkbM family methyltransferase n=1 Tax=Nonomuraea sp. bgisy101 TaxID=3413784 RepID=UPI003D70E7EE
MSTRLELIAGAFRAGAALALSEPEILGLPQLIRAGDVCFDIGAAYGMYTYPLAALVGPAGQVHSFEPLPNPYRILAAGCRVAAAPRIRATNAALGPEPGAERMTLPFRFGLPIHGWAHLRTGQQRAGRHVSFSSAKTLTVEVRGIDEYCAAAGIDRVAFMKVDVEGFEARVLEGAAEIIGRDRPSLLLEIEDRHLDKYGMRSEDLVEPLLKSGYLMYAWSRRGWARVRAVTTARRNYLFAEEGRLTGRPGWSRCRP